MLKELYKSIRSYFIKQRLLDERVLWNDVWWTLLMYGNTVHLRDKLSEKTLSTMDSTASEIVSEFRAKEVMFGTTGETTEVQRQAFMEIIKENR